jgi:hypothetical protein
MQGARIDSSKNPASEEFGVVEGWVVGRREGAPSLSSLSSRIPTYEGGGGAYGAEGGAEALRVFVATPSLHPICNIIQCTAL